MSDGESPSKIAKIDDELEFVCSLFNCYLINITVFQFCVH